MAKGPKIESSESQHFNLKAKLLKSVPGRPVTSSVNCHTSKISEYVDYHQPVVRENPMSKTQVISCEKLMQLNSSQTTTTLYHLI